MIMKSRAVVQEVPFFHFTLYVAVEGKALLGGWFWTYEEAQAVVDADQSRIDRLMMSPCVAY